MSYISDLINNVQQAGIDPAIDAGCAVRRGWDYWEPLRRGGDRSAPFASSRAIVSATTKPDTDGTGMARIAHRHLLDDSQLPPNMLPILDVGMTVQELLAGIWRQSLVRPSDAGDPIGDNPYLVSNCHGICPSSRYLMTLIGHPPRDLALWFDELRRHDPDLFRLVLAKNFKAALTYDPDIVSYPWPKMVRKMWRDEEADYLPPFHTAVLYAELARTAMNHAGLVECAFDGETELTTKKLLDRVGTSFGPGKTVAASRAISYAPFQTLALGLPDSIIEAEDIPAMEAWVQTAASHIALVAGELEGIDIAPSTEVQANSLRAGFAAHPQFLPEPRKGKGSSIQPRRTSIFWGVAWRLNAAVRLLEIAETAREWNRCYRPSGPQLPVATNFRKANPVARAITAIRFRWTAEASRPAAKALLGEVLSKAEKKEFRFEEWLPKQIEPLTIDNHLGAKSGLSLQEKALAEIGGLPKPGELGYSARSQAHLWLDDVGDDIAQYRQLEKMPMREHSKALHGNSLPSRQRPSGIPPEIVAMLAKRHGITMGHGAIGHNQKLPRLGSPNEMTSATAASLGAQFEGQRVSPLSTDPMWARLLRNKKKKS